MATVRVGDRVVSERTCAVRKCEAHFARRKQLTGLAAPEERFMKFVYSA